MDVRVLTETDVRQIIRDELNQSINQDECVEAAQPQLVKVRITFKHGFNTTYNASNYREYHATPETARKMAAHFADGHAGGAYDVFLDTKPSEPHVIGLRFEHILSIG